jgi:hypothetical protein
MSVCCGTPRTDLLSQPAGAIAVLIEHLANGPPLVGGSAAFQKAIDSPPQGFVRSEISMSLDFAFERSEEFFDDFKFKR